MEYASRWKVWYDGVVAGMQWHLIKQRDLARREEIRNEVRGSGNLEAREIPVQRTCLRCEKPAFPLGMPTCTQCLQHLSKKTRKLASSLFIPNRPLATEVKRAVLKDLGRLRN